MQCTAKSKRSQERCKNRSMKGKTVCRMHGGKSKPAGKGNKRALKTGRYETILFETLTEKEKKIYLEMTTDALESVIEKIKILKIRELRILARISELKNKKENSEKPNDNMIIVSGTKTQSVNAAGEQAQSVSVNTKSSDVLAFELEEALTRVQNELGRWVDRLAMYREKYGDGEEKGPLNINVAFTDMSLKGNKAE